MNMQPPRSTRTVTLLPSTTLFRATENPLDRVKVVGRPTNRIDGPLKTGGTAPYAYERHDVAPNQAYGYVVGSAIAKGRISAIDTKAADRKSTRLNSSH